MVPLAKKDKVVSPKQDKDKENGAATCTPPRPKILQKKSTIRRQSHHTYEVFGGDGYIQIGFTLMPKTDNVVPKLPIPTHQPLAQQLAMKSFKSTLDNPSPSSHMLRKVKARKKTKRMKRIRKRCVRRKRQQHSENLLCEMMLKHLEMTNILDHTNISREIEEEKTDILGVHHLIFRGHESWGRVNFFFRRQRQHGFFLFLFYSDFYSSD